MRTKLIVAAVGLLSALSANAALTVVDFESVPGASRSTTVYPIPDGYAGLHWSTSFGAVHKSYAQDNGYANSGYEFGAIGDYVGFSAYAYPISFWSDDDFDFKGLYLASAWTPAESVTITAFNNGVQKYSSIVTATDVEDQLPQLFAFNWKGVDEVVFSGY